MANVAETIRQQIGHKALYMMGAKNLLNHGNALSFRIRGSRKVNYIKITLNSMDTYDLEFGKIHGMNYRIVEEFEGAYADMLHCVIEHRTGLHLSL
jgi:hypothetical protein